MFQIRKILAPVDFSDRSLGAARFVNALVQQFGAQAVLLHVLPPPHYEFSSMEVGGTVISELFETRTRQVRGELENFLQDEIPELDAERVLVEGDPAQRIVEYARDNNSELIVMPTHGYGPFRRFILGSVTAKVLHDADSPVWTGVHLDEKPPGGRVSFKTVMAAIDLGDQSGKTLAWAAGFAASYGARLLVVHAMPCLEGNAGDYPDPGWQERLRNECGSEIEALLGDAARDAEVMLECGDPPDVVREAAAETKADLLVIGRGSAAGVFGRLRANAYTIIRRSPCPVVSV